MKSVCPVSSGRDGAAKGRDGAGEVAGGVTDGGDGAGAVLAVDADGEIAQGRHRAGQPSGADLGVVLAECAVAHVVQEVLDAPVSPIQTAS